MAGTLADETLGFGVTGSGGGSQGPIEQLQRIGEGLNTLVSSGLFGFGYQLFLNAINQPILDKFRAEQEERADRVVGGVTDASNALARQTGVLGAQNLRESELFFGTTQPRAFDALQEEARGFGSEIVALQRARRESVLSEIEGLGDAERANLNRQFDRLSSRARGSLTASGLAGGSVGISALSGVERVRSQERSLLEERLTGERVDRISGLSQDVIDAQQFAGELNLGLSGERISFDQSNFANLATGRDIFGLAGARAERQAALDIADVESSIVREPPLIGGQT